MIIDCCTKEEPGADSNSKAEAVCEVVPERCRGCGNQGTAVSRKTVLSMLKPDLLEQALTGIYRFCGTRECPTVYFEEQGARLFTTDDLRVIVGVKANSDPIPLCYCFGFDESHLRRGQGPDRACTRALAERQNHLHPHVQGIVPPRLAGSRLRRQHRPLRSES